MAKKRQYSDSSKILLIDDAGLVVQSVKKQLSLSPKHFEYTTVQNEQGFLDHLLENTPDIIVTAPHLQKSNFKAVDAVTITRQNYAFLPVIVFAEHISDEHIIDCMHAGIRDIVTASQSNRLITSVITAIAESQAQYQAGITSEALQRAGRQWRATFDAMSDGICVTDDQGCIQYANDAFRKILSIPWPNIIGAKLLALFANPANLFSDSFYGSIQLQSVGRTYELNLDDQWYRVTINPHIVPEGFADQIIHVFSNITQNKVDQEKIEQQSKWIRALNQFSREVVQQVDFSSTLQVAFRYLEEYFDFSFASLLFPRGDSGDFEIAGVSQKGKGLAANLGILPGTVYSKEQVPNIFLNIQHPEGEIIDLQSVEHESANLKWLAIREAFVTAGITHTVKIPIVTAYRYTVILFLSYSGEVQITSQEWEFLQNLCEYIALSARNRRLFDELEASYKEIDRIKDITARQRRMEAMGQIASGIAHDINNTLVPISLYSEALLGPAFSLGEQAEKYIRLINKSIDDIETITSRLRTFYKGNDDSRFDSVDIHILFKEVIELTSPKWKTQALNSGVDITVSVEAPDSVPILQANPGELREALINLMFNAVDAMPSGGGVKLIASSSNETVFLSVEDTGNGMNSEQIERCLEPFFTTKGVRGSGLGLPGVYGVAQRHKGSLQISSTEGKGSTFTLALPIQHNIEKPHQTLPDGSCIETFKILVVDDDPRVLDALRELLLFDGHVVSTAADADDALSLIRKSLNTDDLFEMVITDMGLENTDGSSLAREIKHMIPSIRVILLTGWGLLMNEGQQPEYVDILMSKPPTMGRIREVLSSLGFKGDR